jgi:hypothetical protein
MQCLTAGFTILAVLFAFGSPAMAAGSVAVRSVEVDGTAFRVTLSDGRIIAQDQLPGTILALGDGTGRQRRIRIDGVERDRQDAAGEGVLYTLSEQDPESGEWRNLCLPGPPPTADGSGSRLQGPLRPMGATKPRQDVFCSPAPAAPRTNASASAIIPTALNPDLCPISCSN